MFKIIRKSFKKNNIVISSVRAFSGFQEDMEKFDFSEKLNVEELKLKEPQNKENMNLCATITNTLDIALESDECEIVVM